MQEPLRKIQQLSDLLKTRYANTVGEELSYVERTQHAPSSKFLLISHLLFFSQISISPVRMGWVSLNTVVADALDNFSVVMDETKAQVQLADLPTVEGDSTQLGQLFLNLLSNALKFSRWDSVSASVVSHIVIAYRQIQAATFG